MKNLIGIICLTLFLSILFSWSIALILFKWKYHTKYPHTLHFLAGKPIIVKQPSPQEEEEHQSCCRLSNLQRPNNQIRIVFSVCIVVILTFSVLIQRPGIKILLDGVQSFESYRLRLYKQVHSAYEVTNEVTRIESEINHISDALLPMLLDDLMNDTDGSDDTVISNIDTINAESEYSRVLKNEQTMSNATIKKFKELAHDAYEKISILKDFQTNKNGGEGETTAKAKLSILQSYLHHAIQKLNNIGKITINLLDAFATPFSTSSSYSDNDDDGSIHHLSKPIKVLIKFSMVPIVILCTLLMAGMCFVWIGDSIKCAQRGLTYGVLPLFVMVVLIGGVVVLIMVCAWIFWINDLCSNTYSHEVSTKSRGRSFSNVFFEAETYEERYFMDVLHYYESGCIQDSNSSPYDFANSYGEILNNSRMSVKSFFDFITSDKIKEVCSHCRSNFEQLQIMTRTLQIKLQVLQGNVVLIPHLLDCERFQSMFIDTVNSPACRQTKIGLMWVGVSMTIVVFCGMVIVTLRSSWLDDQIENNDETGQHNSDEDVGYQQCVQPSLMSKFERNVKEEKKQLCDFNEDISRLMDAEKCNEDIVDETSVSDPLTSVPLPQSHGGDGDTEKL